MVKSVMRYPATSPPFPENKHRMDYPPSQPNPLRDPWKIPNVNSINFVGDKLECALVW